MKCFLFILFTFIVAVQSSIYNTLRDGEDAVFKFENDIVESYLKPKSYERGQFDIYLRKAMNDKTFFVQFRNYQRNVNKPEVTYSDEEQHAMEYPLLITLTDRYELDHIRSLPHDFRKTVKDKYEIIEFLLMDMGDLVNELPTILRDIHTMSTTENMDDLPFGTCNANMKFDKRDNVYYVEVDAKKSQCRGEIDHELFGKTGMMDVTSNSEFKISFVFDQMSKNLHGMDMNIKAKNYSNQRHIYKINIKAHFDEYRPIDYELNDYEYTVVHSADGIKQLKEEN